MSAPRRPWRIGGYIPPLRDPVRPPRRPRRVWLGMALAAIIAAGAAVFHNLTGHPFSAIIPALNGITFAILAILFLLDDMNRHWRL